MLEEPRQIDVLVIDDEEAIRIACERVLVKRGYAVRLAPDGKAGLEALSQGAPDVVLLDLKMPDMGGMAVLEEIKRISPTSACVVITAYATVSIARQALRNGAADFLPKPFTPDELCSVVDGALSQGLLDAGDNSLRNVLDDQIGPSLIRAISDLDHLRDSLTDQPEATRLAGDIALRLEKILARLDAMAGEPKAQ